MRVRINFKVTSEAATAKRVTLTRNAPFLAHIKKRPLRPLLFDPSDALRIEFGAGNETRTRDPDLGKVVLYQLSYSRVVMGAILAISKTASTP